MFRPCIDLHEGHVKQIVGGSIGPTGDFRTNFVSERPAAWYARLYRHDALKGGHIIMLGPGNDEPARSALAAYLGGLQIGGGITEDNAFDWLDAGASHVIVTSWVFPNGELAPERLSRLRKRVGKDRLVLDLSCRKRDNAYWVVTDRWQRFTQLQVTQAILQQLAEYCAEFLIHAVDVEGLCRGVDLDLVRELGQELPIPITYAGGTRSMEDLLAVTEVGQTRVDLTIGSALDIFGGHGVRYADAVAFNRGQYVPEPST